MVSVLVSWRRVAGRSTLVPYTTLFRSRDHGGRAAHHGGGGPLGDRDVLGPGRGLVGGVALVVSGDGVGPGPDDRGGVGDRSAEHRAELQSRQYGVGRPRPERKRPGPAG